MAWRLRHQSGYVSAFEDVLAMGGAGVLVFDRRGRLQHSNTFALGAFSVLSDSERFGSIENLIAYVFDHACEDGSASSHSYRVIQGGEDRAHFREVIADSDGHSYLVEMYKGENSRTIVLVRNVSALRAQNERLSVLGQMNAELSLAIEATSSAVFIVDPSRANLPVIFSNRMCQQLAVGGDDVQEIENFYELLHAFGKSDDTVMVLEAMNQQEAMQKQVEFKKGDEVSWFDFRLSPVLKESGDVDLCVGVLSDITQFKKRESEFYRAQKLESLGQLSAGLAHDFNNILSIIEGYARMIEMNGSKPDVMIGYAERVREASQRASGLTSKMMTFARHKQVQDRVCDIGAVFYEQVDLLAPLLDEDIVFHDVCDSGGLHARCSGDDFAQIMMNLAINARDAMPDGGMINVSLNVVTDPESLPDFVRNRDRDYLCLKVRDNGAGMAEDICDRVFDPFFTTKEQGKGTGLGLSVVYGLVNDCGGYIDVRSELSVGTEFCVYIPSTEAAASERKVDFADIGVVESFKGYTALVVEDEPDLKEIIATVLGRYDMTVLEASYGDEALVVLDDCDMEVDVLITDLVMPGISGLKLAEMAQALIPNLAVIYMSGYPARGEDAKVDIPEDAIFIPKPIDFDVLYDSVAAALQGAHSEVIPFDDYKKRGTS